MLKKAWLTNLAEAGRSPVYSLSLESNDPDVAIHERSVRFPDPSGTGFRHVTILSILTDEDIMLLRDTLNKVIGG